MCFLESFKIVSAAYCWREEDPFLFWRFSLLPFQSYWTWYDGKYDFYPMSYDNLSSVSRNVLKFDQQLTGEERRIPFIYDDFHFWRSRVIGLDMTENMIFTLCRMITWVVFLRMILFIIHFINQYEKTTNHVNTFIRTFSRYMYLDILKLKKPV